MGGGADVCACSDEHVMGIIPRVINVLFARVQDDQLYNYTIRVSYLEVSNIVAVIIYSIIIAYFLFTVLSIGFKIVYLLQTFSASVISCHHMLYI
jgi:hypothetical protein